MSESKFISTNFAAVLVYGRPPLVFGGMLFAVAVMLNQSLTAYIAGPVSYTHLRAHET